MFSRLKSLFQGTTVEAASQLPIVAPIKAKAGQRSWPAFFQTTKPSTSAISRPDRRLINKDTLDYRSGASTHKVLQDMVAASPELSNAVYTAIRLGVPEKYVAVARNMDGSLNPEATGMLQELLTRFDVVGDPSQGYMGTGSLKSCSESLARDMIMYGQMTAELILDKSMVPSRIQPISSTIVQFKPDGRGYKPFQKVGDLEVDLDVPTVAIVQLDDNLIDPYSTSPMETALKAVIFSETFMADLTRVMRRAIHPRLLVTVDEDKFRKNLSPEAQMDPDLANAEMGSLISSIETKVNGLNPEDALIFFDSLGFDIETPTGAGAEYTTLQNIANAKLASGSKTLPSVLGLQSAAASSSIASVEVLLYVKSVDSSIRQKLNEILSRLLTVAIRLMGVDGYVSFTYEPISIRNEAEMEAFHQTRQMRILELLSLGLMGDEEASLMLTGKLPPVGFKPLSGTMFKQPGAGGDSGAAGQDTAGYNGASNDGSAANKALKPDTPSTARGQNKKA